MKYALLSLFLFCFAGTVEAGHRRHTHHSRVTVVRRVAPAPQARVYVSVAPRATQGPSTQSYSTRTYYRVQTNCPGGICPR